MSSLSCDLRAGPQPQLTTTVIVLWIHISSLQPNLGVAHLVGLVLTLFTSFEPLLSAKNFCASRKPHSATGLPVSINPSLSSGVVWLWGQGRSHGKGQRTSTDWGWGTALRDQERRRGKGRGGQPSIRDTGAGGHPLQCALASKLSGGPGSSEQSSRHRGWEGAVQELGSTLGPEKNFSNFSYWVGGPGWLGAQGG